MKEELIEKAKYIAEQTTKLCEKVIGRPLPISSLTIFSHTNEEFENFKTSLSSMGVPYNENNGPRITLNEAILVGSNKIIHLRIRKPDAERPQVGCNDFDVENYGDFKNKYLAGHQDNLRLIVRPEYEMIEFFDPEFDVLAYVVTE